MPKIVMLLTNSGVYDARVSREARTLASAGYDLTILGMNEHGATSAVERHPDGYTIRKSTLFMKRFKKGSFILLLKWLEFCAKSFLLGIREKPDIVHVHDLHPLPMGYLLARLFRAKLIYDSHEIWYGVPELKPRFFWMGLERLIITRCDCVITANESRAELMWKRYPGMQGLVPLHNYTQKFQVSEDRPLTRVVDKSKKRVILYQGVIRRERGLENLIESCRKWSDKWLIVVIGYSMDDEYMQELHRDIDRHGLKEKILFLGAVKPKELPNYIASADVGFLFYKNDSLNNAHCAPNKLYDYLNMGVPVLCNDLPGLKMVPEKGFGRFFEGDIPEKDLDALLEAPIGKQEFYWEKEEHKLLDLYRSLDKNQPGEPAAGSGIP